MPTYGTGTYGADTYGGGAAPAYDPPGSSGPVRFRYRVAISITTSDGRVLRYGPDEPRADGVPFATTYSSTIPGGHDQATFSLRTKITDELPFTLLDDVRIYGPGNVTLWEGYVTQLPRQSGDDFLVNVQCVGHSGRLKWDTGFMETYVNRNLGDWQGPSTQYMLDRVTMSNFSGEVGNDDTGGPEIRQTVSGLGSTTPLVTSFYRSPTDIGSIYYENRAIGGSIAGDANYAVNIGLDNDDTATAFTDQTGDIAASTPASGTLSAAGTGRRFIFAYWFYSVASTWPQTYGIAWQLSVFGNHGLTKRGTGIDQGFYGHDVLEDVVSRAGSGLTSNVTENTSFIIPQLAFLTPSTAEDVILELNKYFLWEWGCWGREFFWRPADADRLTWEARMDQGAHLNLEGDEAGNAINGVIVSYSLPDGTAKTVGPVGSGATVEDTSLGDVSSSNTVNAHGIARKFAKLDVSFSTTDSGATAIGAAYLAQQALPARKGSINLTGYVQHPTKGLRPVSEVRAGDWVRVSDSSSPQIARRIVQVSHDADNRQCQLDVGNDVDKVDAILQRVGIRSSLIG